MHHQQETGYIPANCKATLSEVSVIMSAKTKRALRKNRYLNKKDASLLYMKEYRESNRNAIRESQKQYYQQNKDFFN